MSKKRALLIAGTGTMGVHVTELLKQEGFECWVTSRSGHNNRSGVYYIKGNPHDFLFLESVLSMYHWTTIVDFTYYSVSEFYKIYKLLLSNTDLYVFLSSARVYADYNGKINEDSPRLLDTCNDLDYINSDEYAIAKAKEEDCIIGSKEKNWLILRPYITYGENTFQLSPIRKEFWLYRALRRKKIYFAEELSKKMTTFTYGYDVARGIVALVNDRKAWGDTYNVMSPISLKWADVLKIYLDILESYLGQRPEVYMDDKWNSLMTGTYEQVKYDRLYDREFDCTKLSRFIDIDSFLSPEEGLKKCLKEFLGSFDKKQSLYMPHEAQVDKVTGDWESLRDLIKLPLKDILRYLYYRIK